MARCFCALCRAPERTPGVAGAATPLAQVDPSGPGEALLAVRPPTEALHGLPDTTSSSRPHDPQNQAYRAQQRLGQPLREPASGRHEFVLCQTSIGRHLAYGAALTDAPTAMSVFRPIESAGDIRMSGWPETATPSIRSA